MISFRLVMGMSAVWALLSFLGAVSASAGEGFLRSSDHNTVMLRGNGRSATAFLLQTPRHGLVLVTRKYLLEAMGKPLTVQWGNAVAWFSRLRVVEDGAYQTQFQPRVIAADEASDLVALRLPHDLFHLCRCEGFVPAPWREGEAKVVGYPVLERREGTNGWARFWRELWGDVRQQASAGKIWTEGEILRGDADALPGNEGGPVLDPAGRVVGVVHEVSASAANDFRYGHPALRFVDLQPLVEALAKP